MNHNSRLKRKKKKIPLSGEFNLKIVSYCSGEVRGIALNNEIQYLMEL